MKCPACGNKTHLFDLQLQHLDSYLSIKLTAVKEYELQKAIRFHGDTSPHKPDGFLSYVEVMYGKNAAMNIEIINTALNRKFLSMTSQSRDIPSYELILKDNEAMEKFSCMTGPERTV